MKTSIRKTLIPTAAALAVAVPATLAGPALAMGNAADARYEAYIAQEAKTTVASRAGNQVTRVGATDSSALYAENGTKRFYLDVSPAQEQHYRGM